MAGVIDFSQARLLDVRWWRRANLLIRSMHDDRELTLLKDAYAFQLALVGNGSLTEDSFKKSQKTAKETFNEICNLARPWAAQSLEEIKGQEVSNLIDLYKQVIGDPNDPEFQAKLAEQERQFAEEAAKAALVSEDEEERVARLIREHREEQQRRIAAANNRG